MIGVVVRSVVLSLLFAGAVYAVGSNCTNCWPRSGGPCHNPSNNVCYDTNMDGSCPTGTVACDQKPTTSPPTVPPPSEEFPFVVYTTEWAQYYRDRSATWCIPFGNTPDHLTASRYTHVNYAFARIDKETSTVMTVEWNAESVLIPQAVALKKTNPMLKVLVSIGGWSFSTSTGAFAPGSTFGKQNSKQIFPDVCADPAKRSTFVNSAIDFCQKWGFDGIDIDWEWPNNTQQKTDFTSLMQELRTAVNANGYLLTTALRGSPTAGFDNYQLDKIHPLVDHINLMTYDYHGGAWENNVPTQVHTPVLDCSSPTHFDMSGAVDHYLSQGVPAKKIMIGLATYGRTFQVASASSSLGAQSMGPGIIGDCSQNTGILTYFEIERALTGHTMVEDTKELIAAYGTFTSTSTGVMHNLVTFDTALTHRLKMCWIRAKGLGGVMTWDGESDDNQYLLTKIRSQIDSPQCSDFVMPQCNSTIAIE